MELALEARPNRRAELQCLKRAIGASPADALPGDMPIWELVFRYLTMLCRSLIGVPLRTWEASRTMMQRSRVVVTFGSCPVCFDMLTAENTASLRVCGHNLCMACMQNIMRSENAMCPLDRRPLCDWRR